MSDNLENTYNRLMDRRDLISLGDDEALEHIGHLTDVSGDLGGDARRLSTRVLEVGRFVVRQTGIAYARPSWPDLHRLWNSTHTEWAYKDYRGFRQTFMRLMHPKYRRPKWKGCDSSRH